MQNNRETFLPTCDNDAFVAPEITRKEMQAKRAINNIFGGKRNVFFSATITRRIIYNGLGNAMLYSHGFPLRREKITQNKFPRRCPNAIPSSPSPTQKHV